MGTWNSHNDEKIFKSGDSTAILNITKVVFWVLENPFR